MRSLEIQRLVHMVEAKYGTVQLFGTHPSEEHGTCFIVRGIPATFSVLTDEGKMPQGTYSVQVESMPPGDYLHICEVSLAEFMELVESTRGKSYSWP